MISFCKIIVSIAASSWALATPLTIICANLLIYQAGRTAAFDNVILNGINYKICLNYEINNNVLSVMSKTVTQPSELNAIAQVLVSPITWQASPRQTWHTWRVIEGNSTPLHSGSLQTMQSTLSLSLAPHLEISVIALEQSLTFSPFATKIRNKYIKKILINVLKNHLIQRSSQEPHNQQHLMDLRAQNKLNQST